MGAPLVLRRLALGLTGDLDAAATYMKQEMPARHATDAYPKETGEEGTQDMHAHRHIV